MFDLKSRRRPLVMGILNITPDSFFPDSRKNTVDNALQRALEMEVEGADILDIGGESSRPGSSYVDALEEKRRILPVVEAIRQKSSIPISIDTRKSEVAREALDAGADIVNDISALRDDPALGLLCADRNVPVVLMHMRESPETMQKNPSYNDVVKEVLQELSDSAAHAESLGIKRENIIIDPGFGFGKRYEDNLCLMKSLGVFSESPYPLLVGVSRKSFIGLATEKDVRERLAGTMACHVLAIQAGAAILRVHDVAETADIIRMIKAIEGCKGQLSGIEERKGAL